MVLGSSTMMPQTCISCAGVSRYRKLASSPDKRSMVSLSPARPLLERVLVPQRSLPRKGTRDSPHRRSTLVVMGFLRRQVVTAALTANAIRPVPGFRAGIPAFMAGWLTSELVPHLMALTAADTSAHVVRRGRRRSKTGLALAAANLAGQAFLADQSRRVRKDAEDALVEGLGYDYIEQLDAKPTPAELATPWRRLVNPFRMRALDVVVEKDIAYAPEHGKRGLLDIYRPAGEPAPGAPVLLQVHGGGWTIGNKDQQGIPLMQHLAAKGWVCVAVNYRLAPRDPFPAQIVDVKRAI